MIISNNENWAASSIQHGTTQSIWFLGGSTVSGADTPKYALRSARIMVELEKAESVLLIHVSFMRDMNKIK